MIVTCSRATSRYFRRSQVVRHESRAVLILRMVGKPRTCTILLATAVTEMPERLIERWAMAFVVSMSDMLKRSGML